MDQNEASNALAAIRQDRIMVAERMTAMGPQHVVAAVAMGAATAAMAIPHLLVVVPATLVVMAGALVAIGTPARAGMVPADTRRGLVRMLAGCAVMLAVFTVAVTAHDAGLPWLALPAGAVEVVTVLAVARWLRVSLRRDLLAG